MLDASLLLMLDNPQRLVYLEIANLIVLQFSGRKKLKDEQVPAICYEETDVYFVWQAKRYS